MWCFPSSNYVSWQAASGPLSRRQCRENKAPGMAGSRVSAASIDVTVWISFVMSWSPIGLDPPLVPGGNGVGVLYCTFVPFLSSHHNDECLLDRQYFLDNSRAIQWQMMHWIHGCSIAAQFCGITVSRRRPETRVSRRKAPRGGGPTAPSHIHMYSYNFRCCRACYRPVLCWAVRRSARVSHCSNRLRTRFGHARPNLRARSERESLLRLRCFRFLRCF